MKIIRSRTSTYVGRFVPGNIRGNTKVDANICAAHSRDGEWEREWFGTHIGMAVPRSTHIEHMLARKYKPRNWQRTKKKSTYTNSHIWWIKHGINTNLLLDDPLHSSVRVACRRNREYASSAQQTKKKHIRVCFTIEINSIRACVCVCARAELRMNVRRAHTRQRCLQKVFSEALKSVNLCAHVCVCVLKTQVHI